MNVLWALTGEDNHEAVSNISFNNLTINFAMLARLHAESLSKNVKNRDQCYKANLAVKQLP